MGHELIWDRAQGRRKEAATSFQLLHPKGISALFLFRRMAPALWEVLMEPLFPLSYGVSQLM